MDAHEEKILAALFITACIVAVILVFFIITIMRYHKRNLLLYKEKLATEIETQEKERRRIASDLHDDLGPILSTVKLQVSVLEGQGAEDRDVVDKVKKNIDDILTGLRAISNDLMPNVLLRKGLYRAIESFADEVNDTGAMYVRLIVEGREDVVPKRAEVHIYRIVQELVNNSLKHSGGKEISIRMKAAGPLLTIYFADDGKGYSEDTVRNENKGIGLESIRNRVELLGGKIRKESAEPGTCYIIELPLNERK